MRKKLFFTFLSFMIVLFLSCGKKGPPTLKNYETNEHKQQQSSEQP